MVNFFEFIFSNFWTWLGFLILLYVPCACIAMAVGTSRTSQKSEEKPILCQFDVWTSGKWVPGKGVFLCWGTDYDEFENGPGNYTIAIIRLPDGSIVKTPPEKVRFGGRADEKQIS